MSLDEFGFGAVPSPPDERDILFSAIIREFPTELNLATIPEKYESPHVTPVKNQGREGTCVGFACAVGMKEAQESKEENKYVELSPRYLYQKCKEIDNYPGEGTYIKTAMQVLQETGVCEWQYWPYVANSINTPLPNADSNAADNKISSYARLDSLDAMKNSLFNNGPFVMGVPVYDNWSEANTNGIIPLPGNSKKGDYHAICIVGYDDSNQKMKFKNSWILKSGELWGDKGFGYLSYEYINRNLKPEIEAWCALDYVIRLIFKHDSEVSGWIGKFSGTEDQLLFFDSNNDWWLCSKTGDGNAKCNPIRNTNGFGGAPRGCPTWIGKFSNNDSDEILFYFPGDNNWWLGSYNGTELKWNLAGNTVGFGHGINDGRPFWVGDFNGDGREDILFYFPGDDNWWLGAFEGTELKWHFVGNTAGFGHGINDGRPFWTGRFSNSTMDEILFYFPGDDNWWLGSYNGSELKWNLAGNTVGFGHGINDGRPFWVGDFNGDGREDILFYFPGDNNWWIGTFTDSKLVWKIYTSNLMISHQ